MVNQRHVAFPPATEQTSKTGVTDRARPLNQAMQGTVERSMSQKHMPPTLKKADDLSVLAARISESVEGVSYAGRFWHETRVAFNHEYSRESDLHAARQPQAESGAPAVEAGVFRGKSVRDGLESADRQNRETQDGKPDGRRVDAPVGRDAVRADGKPRLDIAFSARQEELQRPGGVRGSDGLLAESGWSDPRAGEGRAADGSLHGLPRSVGEFAASAFRPAAGVAEKYMASRGETYSPPATYANLNHVLRPGFPAL